MDYVCELLPDKGGYRREKQRPITSRCPRAHGQADRWELRIGCGVREGCEDLGNGWLEKGVDDRVDRGL